MLQPGSIVGGVGLRCLEQIRSAGEEILAPDMHDGVNGVDEALLLADQLQQLHLVEKSRSLAQRQNPDQVVIKCLLMTSAEPAISRDGRLAYSPFIQGSGSPNVARALTLGDTHCAQSTLDIDLAISGKEKLEGPATRDTKGAPSLPNIDNLLSPIEPSRGLSDDRRWGVKAHLERLDPENDAPQATGVPFDWGGAYKREAEKIKALSEEK